MDRITGLKDLQDYGLLLSWVLIKDRIAGLLFKAKLVANKGQDYRIPGFTGKVVFKLSWALTMDRIKRLQDLQDRFSFG